MATAQVEAWVGAHRGSIDAVTGAIDTALADAALGQMMLHRRRAIVASIVCDFFDKIGDWSAPYLEGRASRVPTDFAYEVALAKSSGELVLQTCGPVAPLLFERAALAEMEGRSADALADLSALIESYPGFFAAAVAAARLELSAGEPSGAIGALVCIERELTQTREGSALLAESLRALGLYDSASYYDLVALSNHGHLDRRGNDCAPIDVRGNVASDQRMPHAFQVAIGPDGRRLFNDRGIYYLAGASMTGSPAELAGGGSSLPTLALSAASSQSFHAEKLESLKARALLFINARVEPHRWPYRAAQAARQLVLTLRAALLGLLVRNKQRLSALLYGVYKRFPSSVRRTFNLWALQPWRWVAQMWATRRAYEIPDRSWNSWIVQTRTQAGLIRILQLRARSLVGGAPYFAAPGWNDSRDTERLFPEIASEEEGALILDGLQAGVLEELPPLAKEVLRRLAGEAISRGRQTGAVDRPADHLQWLRSGWLTSLRTKSSGGP